MAGSEAFALIIMGGASYALIRAFDFILRNLSNTLDYRAGNLANRDRDTTPWGDVVEVPAAAKGGGGAAAQGSSRVRTGQGSHSVDESGE